LPHFIVPRNDGALSFSREGHVGGLRSAPVQGHVSTDLATATAGSGESASDQLPEPKSELVVQPVWQPGSRGPGQNKTERL